MCGLRFTNVKHSKNGFAWIRTTMAKLIVHVMQPNVPTRKKRT